MRSKKFVYTKPFYFVFIKFFDLIFFISLLLKINVNKNLRYYLKKNILQNSSNFDIRGQSIKMNIINWTLIKGPPPIEHTVAVVLIFCILIGTTKLLRNVSLSKQ